MSQMRTIEISESAYAIVVRQAALAGVSPASWLAQLIEKETSSLDHGPNGTDEDAQRRQVARDRFERHFGTWTMPSASGVDNEQIDADLVSEYLDTHEEP